MEFEELIAYSYYHDDTGILLQGDCLEWMTEIQDDCIDMILCDLPYGRTANAWDIIIPLDKLWPLYRKLAKVGCPIVLSCIEPYTSKLVISNMRNYHHKWVWNKNNSAGFMTCKYRPFQICEDILIFGWQKVNYYPIMENRGKPRISGGYTKSSNYHITPNITTTNSYYPKNLLYYSDSVQRGKLHPTQKPVALYEYLINTYSKEGDIILDNAAGSCTTAIACKNTHRRWICIEKEEKYCEISAKRIQKHA